MDSFAGRFDNPLIMPSVAKPRRQLRKTFLREWREYRELTQEQAAERLNIERSHLSRIERGQVPYSQGLLEAAAEAYRCEPWDLLHVNPAKEGEVIDLMRILENASPEDRAEIVGYAKGRLTRH